MTSSCLTPSVLADLRTSLTSSYIEGLTHGFYHYPARFSPTVVRTAIDHLTRKSDWVLDPFMGGGTSVVEGLALGRRIVGVDINNLAHFVADVRTRPLSPRDQAAIRTWVEAAGALLSTSFVDEVSPMAVRNMPASLDRFMSAAVSFVEALNTQRQQAFARCLLLRLGQWALDCRESRIPRRQRLAAYMDELAERMFEGLEQLVEASREAGVAKNLISSRRVLLNRSSVGLEHDPALRALDRKPKLVLTSPPYPGVHVLYHRWQYKGRKETPAPYRIAAVEDGHPEKYYMGGSRTPTGLNNYFEMIEAAFTSVREVMSSRGIVVQIIGFSDPQTQVRRYQAAMKRAGFEPCRHPSGEPIRLSRQVQNRKWYHRVRSGRNGGSERVLLHRPA